MASPTWSFDFSRMNPMFDAVSTYMPRLLALKLREQESLAPLVPAAARMSINRGLEDQALRERESSARISGEAAAQALQRRLADVAERERTSGKAEGEQQAFRQSYVNNMLNRQGTTMVPGMGRPDVGYEADLLAAGKLGGVHTLGTEPSSFEQQSAAWNARRCAANPLSPGCPGTGA